MACLGLLGELWQRAEGTDHVTDRLDFQLLKLVKRIRKREVGPALIHMLKPSKHVVIIKTCNS